VRNVENFDYVEKPENWRITCTISVGNLGFRPTCMTRNDFQKVYTQGKTVLQNPAFRATRLPFRKLPNACGEVLGLPTGSLTRTQSIFRSSLRGSGGQFSCKKEPASLPVEQKKQPIVLYRVFSKLSDLSGNSDEFSVSVPYLAIFLEDTVVHKTRTDNALQRLRRGQIANAH
jgi:hypothetical protein